MAASEVFLVCGHCGSATNCQLKAGHTQGHTNHAGGRVVIYWQILECPICHGLMLNQIREEPYEESEEQVLYPAPKTPLTNLPVTIAKEYEATLKIQFINANACAVLARRTLEAIFIHEGATGGTLEKKIDSLIKSASIPPLLADIAHIGRRIGNLGAHFDIGEATNEDVAVMIDFLETILEYLYVIPAKVASVKARIDKTL